MLTTSSFIPGTLDELAVRFSSFEIDAVLIRSLYGAALAQCVGRLRFNMIVAPLDSWNRQNCSYNAKKTRM